MDKPCYRRRAHRNPPLKRMGMAMMLGRFGRPPCREPTGRVSNVAMGVGVGMARGRTNHCREAQAREQMLFQGDDKVMGAVDNLHHVRGVV